MKTKWERDQNKLDTALRTGGDLRLILAAFWADDSLPQYPAGAAFTIGAEGGTRLVFVPWSWPHAGIQEQHACWKMEIRTPIGSARRMRLRSSDRSTPCILSSQ